MLLNDPRLDVKLKDKSGRTALHTVVETKVNLLFDILYKFNIQERFYKLKRNVITKLLEKVYYKRREITHFRDVI